MNRIIFTFLFLFPFVGHSFAQQQKYETLQVMNEERQEYQNEVQHFITHTYYDMLVEAIATTEVHNSFINYLMQEDVVKYMPEFVSNYADKRYMSPAQYFGCLHRAFSAYNSDELKFSINNMQVDNDFYSYGLRGCFIRAEYDLEIKYQNEILSRKRCRMYCLFPNRSSKNIIKVMQLEPVKDLMSENDTGSGSEMRAIAKFLSWAESYEEGLQWLNMEKKENYMPIFAKLAEEGYIEAQWRYGKCLLEEGRYGQALPWFEVAANQGHVTAQNDLGYMYDMGLGVNQDLEKAVALYCKAAAQGCGQALLNLGWCYEHGIGVVKDEKKAFLLYSKSSEAGNYIAKARIAQCYYDGIGVEEDKEAGWKFYRYEVMRILGSGIKDVGFQISGCGQGNHSIGKDLVKWHKKAVVRKSHCSAIRTLGYCQYYGIGIKKDRNKAYRLFMKSQNKDCCNEEILGMCYEYGFGVEQNYSKAVAYYRYDGSCVSYFRLARCYENGTGVEKDYKVSAIFYRKSAEKGNIRSQMKLGHMYLTGKGVSKDTTEAKKWFMIAADNGNNLARLIVRELNLNSVNTN